MNIRHYLLSTLLVCAGSIVAPAQTKWLNPQSSVPNVVHGQYWQEEMKGNYARLPERAHTKVRDAVWNLSRQSAGLSLVFRSDAPEIKVRYTVSGGLAMPHMPSTGVSGVDLYATDLNGGRRWCAGRYSFGDTISYTYGNLTYDTKDRGYEYHLYLPLYNEVKWLEIGVPDSYQLIFEPSSVEKPIVVYGTSIAQGACASRPGMAWSNIIERELEHPLINLGFSGNGRLEPELFDFLSEIEAKLYIIDCMPNLAGENAKVVYQRTMDGIHRLREKHATPILLVEHSGYTNFMTNQSSEESFRKANIELKRAYNALIKEGVKDIYYMMYEEIGLSMDEMVEGIHPSDLGMRKYADNYIKKIKEILHEDCDARTVFSPCKQRRDGYDWNGRHNAILKMNQEKSPDILMIGNPITHYWSGEPTASIVNGKEAWNNLFKGKNVRNLGFGWDRIENALWRIYHGELDGFAAKKIFLLLGTNNLDVNSDEEIIQGIQELVRAVRLRQPEARIYVCGILPRAWKEERIIGINQSLQMRLQPDEMTFVDMSAALSNPDGSIVNSLFKDGVHPTAEGYQQMVEILKQYVNEP